MILAWLGAALIGLSLGLLGSGGSILTVPVLVYLVGQPEKIAIAGSLAIVGGISLVGALPYALRRLVHWRSVLFFGVPGMIGTYGGAWLARYVPGTAQLALFAAVMLVAAVMMLRGGDRPEGPGRPRAFWKVGLDGLAVGIVTGLVGVGGGFLIVPALVLLGGLPMPLAVGTSLLIIAMKSATGFYKYLDVLGELDMSLDWQILGLFIAVGVVGSVAGNFIATRMPRRALEWVFGVFLVVMGGVILGQSIPRLL